MRVPPLPARERHSGARQCPPDDPSIAVAVAQQGPSQIVSLQPDGNASPLERNAAQGSAAGRAGTRRGRAERRGRRDAAVALARRCATDRIRRLPERRPGQPRRAARYAARHGAHLQRWTDATAAARRPVHILRHGTRMQRQPEQRRRAAHRHLLAWGRRSACVAASMPIPRPAARWVRTPPRVINAPDIPW